MNFSAQTFGPCLLCGDAESRSLGSYAVAKVTKRYHCCGLCGLVWMHPGDRPGREEERAHYESHQNDPRDERYREFLNRLWVPMRARLPGSAHGLDFGSGPGPTLHQMAEQDGYSCVHFDPVFHPDRSLLDHRYDFVTCSETAEHFFDPRAEFRRLSDCLRPNGWLGVMTSRLFADTDFPNWHYRHDPTHVCFYRDETFRFIARNFGFDQPEFVSPSVVLMRKQA